ncbi:hypothetical protein BH20ACI3_BH20ACI3_24980 [soil metagenome]
MKADTVNQRGIRICLSLLGDLSALGASEQTILETRRVPDPNHFGMF